MATEKIEIAGDEQENITLSDEQLDAEYLKILNFANENDRKVALAKPKQVKLQMWQNHAKLEGKQKRENSAKSLVDSVAQTGHEESVRKLNVLLRTAPVSWIEEFLAAYGPLTLSKTLEKANADKTHELQTELVHSFKIIVKSTQQLDELINTESIVHNLVTVVTSTKDTELKTEVFLILRAIGGRSAAGAAQVEAAMVQVFGNDFSAIVESVSAAKDQELRISLLSSLNQVAGNLSEKTNFLQLVKQGVSGYIEYWGNGASADLAKEISTLNSLFVE